MKKDSDEWFDKLWEEAVEQNYRIEVPDPQSSWERVARKLAKERARARRRTRIKMYAAVTAAFVLGAFLFSLPQQGSAYKPVMKLMTNLTGDVVTLFNGEKKNTEGALTSPPPEEFVEAKPRTPSPSAVEIIQPDIPPVVMSLEEVKKKVDFPVLVPDYLPEGYRYVDTTFLEDVLNPIVVLRYMKGDDELFLKESPAAIADNMGIGYDKNSLNASTIDISGQKSVYLQGRPGQASTMYYKSGQTLVNLTGKLSTEDMIKLLEQLK